LTPKSSSSQPLVVVFDLGGVIVDWNPRYLMDRAIPNARTREEFLAWIPAANLLPALDIAPDSRAAIGPIIAQHPEYAAEITTYIDRFEETVAGEFPDMAALALRLHSANIALYGLTNWAGDTFELVRPRLPTLTLMRDIVVSGHEGIIKPDPRIFELMCRRGNFTPSQAVFIDDSLRNAQAARSFGMAGIHHRSAELTISELRALGLPA
jgi:2-haloacid dehalogenase